MPSLLATCHRFNAPWRTVKTRFNTSLLPGASSGRVRHAMAGQLNAASSAQGVPMIERISLLSFPEEFREEAGAAAVDNIWSLQYMAPGALCGAAGPLIQLPTGGTQQQQQPAEQQPLPFTHAVMLRFANSRNLEGFQAHPRTQSVTAAVLDGGCTGMSVLTVATQLPNELESLFRRGGDFDIGFELIAVLRLAEGASKSDAEDVLRQLQQLAESSVFGAVQASQGPCTQLQQLHGPAGEEPAVGAASLTLQRQPDYVFMARFQTQEQLTSFLRCPPVEALLQWDERLPLRAEWAGAMEVAPTEKSQSTSQGKGRLL